MSKRPLSRHLDVIMPVPPKPRPPAGAIRFHASDLGEPLLFSDLPGWLTEAIDDDRITSFGAGEDYWYLRVQTEDGPVTASPGDWISRSPSGALTVTSAAEPSGASS
jgi:hypothetical protein